MKKTINFDEAVSYVLQNGNIIEKARMNCILWDKSPSHDVLEELKSYQHPNGGFTYWVKEISNLCDTAYVLQWLEDLKIFRGPIAEPACKFILDRQLPDGGWDEVKEILAYNPPEWMIPGRIETRVWLTAFCAHVLIQFGYAEAEGTYCPTDFLLANCDKKGRLVGYFRATWISLPMLAFYPGEDPKSFHRAIQIVNKNSSPDREGSYLAWLLRCLQDAGLDVNHFLVARFLKELVRKQKENGSWEPEEGEGEKLAVNATIMALRVLKMYKLI
jgi:hypothetical protein